MEQIAVFGAGIVTYMIRGWIANKIMAHGRRLITKSNRNSAIWQHYQKQAKGQGHASASVLECGEENCQVFGRVPQTA